MEKSDLSGGVIMTIISLASLIYSLQLPQGVTEMGVLKAGVFPVVISSALLLCSLVLLTQSVLVHLKKNRFLNFNLTKNLKLIYSKPMLWIYSVFAYFFLVDFIGYLIASFLYLFVTLWLYFKTKLIPSIIVGVTVTVGTYLIFDSFLGISLPTGLM